MSKYGDFQFQVCHSRKDPQYIFIYLIYVLHIFLYRGQDDSELEEAFRAEYGHLSELRSMLRREVPFIALTATATDAVRTTIIKDLCMFDCVQLLTVPNKPHTKFSVETANVEDLYSTFSWLIDDIEQKQQKAAKVLIFCRKRAHV